jgi:hypothetical protein
MTSHPLRVCDKLNDQKINQQFSFRMFTNVTFFWKNYELTGIGLKFQTKPYTYPSLITESAVYFTIHFLNFTSDRECSFSSNIQMIFVHVI